MVQTAWVALISEAASVLFQKCIDNDAALRSCFSGETAPTDPAPVAGQLWFKPSTKEMFCYSGTTWVQIAKAQTGASPNMDSATVLASVTATITVPMDVARGALTVEGLDMLSDTTTTSNGTDYWQVQIKNQTTGNNLRATAFSTNGSEITAWTTKSISVDQNQSVSAGDVLRITITKNGSATNLGFTRLILRAVPA